MWIKMLNKSLKLNIIIGNKKKLILQFYVECVEKNDVVCKRNNV